MMRSRNFGGGIANPKYMQRCKEIMSYANHWEKNNEMRSHDMKKVRIIIRLQLVPSLEAE